MSQQYVYSMLRVSKVVPPQKTIIKDISLSFFPGAKIGLLGLNGAGKSTVLRIMAGVDKEFEGEAVPMGGIKIGYLPQEPELDPEKTVREEVESGLGEVAAAQKRLEEVYAEYANPDADFDALAEEQGRLEAIIAAGSSTVSLRISWLVKATLNGCSLTATIKNTKPTRNAVWVKKARNRNVSVINR